MKRNYNENLIPIKSIHQSIFKYERERLKQRINRLKKKKEKLEISNTSIEDINDIQKDIDNLETEYKNKKTSFDNLRKRCEEKRSIIAEKYPNLAFYYNENHKIKKGLTQAEAIIYESLIRAAATKNTIVHKWCSANQFDNENETELIQLYENLKDSILKKCTKENCDDPFIFKWLNKLAYTLDYSMCMLIDNIKHMLLVLKTEGLGIRNQINFDSIIKSNGYQQRYIDFQFGVIPSAVPKLEFPENYKKFKHEVQFFEGLISFLWRFMYPNLKLKAKEQPVTINEQFFWPLRTAKELNEEIYVKEYEYFKTNIHITEDELKNTSDKELKEKLNERLNLLLKGEHRCENKESRISVYRRKCKEFKKYFPEGASFLSVNNFPNISRKSKHSKTVKKKKTIKYDFEQQALYFSIIRWASIPGSIVNHWLSKRFKNDELIIVMELYCYLYKEIYGFLKVDRPGFFPLVDQWLQLLDVELDYSVAVLIENILSDLYQLRHETYKQRYEKAVNSESKYTSKEEIFLEDFLKLINQYIVEIKEKCSDYLSFMIEYGCLYYNTSNNSEDKNILKGKFPEYVQAFKNLKRYLNTNNNSIKVLDKLNMSIDQANLYLDFLISSYK